MENLYNGLSVRDDEEQGVEVWVESKEVKTVSIESEDDQARAMRMKTWKVNPSETSQTATTMKKRRYKRR
jgi:hypothetical protein